MNVTVKARQSVLERDGGMCMHCATTEALTIQHRANRGMGGDKAGRRNNLANLITLCHESNVRLEADAMFAARGIRKGWKLRSTDDATSIPVFHAGYGEWWLLNEEGGRQAIGTEMF